jgi:hypothetical protein
MLYQSLGSFGPEGFAPAGKGPGKSCRGELRYRTTRWGASVQQFLAFPDRVFTVDVRRRTVQTLLVPVAGETVAFARWLIDDLDTRPPLIVMSTEQSVHFFY